MKIASTVLVSLSALLTACNSNAPTTAAAPAQTRLLASIGSVNAASYQAAVQELYVAYYGRPADPAGLAYWESALLAAGAPTDLQLLNASYASNAGVRATVDSFGNSAESVALYGSGNANAIVSGIYQNVLNRLPDAPGLAYWADAISKGLLSQGQAALAIVASASAQASTSVDELVVNNRLIIATEFTSQVIAQNAASGYSGGSANKVASALLASVSASTDANAFKASVGASVATMAPTSLFSEIPAASLAGFTDKTITVANDELNVLSLAQEKLIGTAPLPDVHQSYLKMADGSNRFWVQGGGGSTLFTTTDFSTFNTTLSNGIVQPVFGPSLKLSTQFDADYAGASSVFPATNKHDLLMLYHAENHYGQPYGATGVTAFYASVGIATSADAGQTWGGRTQVLTGREPITNASAGTAIGAGNPTAIVTGGYIYVFYGDMVSKNGAFKGQNALCLARAPVAGNGAAGTWMKYYNGSFSQPGIGGLCSAPVPAPTAKSGITFQADADISYNSALHAYLLVFRSDDGFFYSTSVDMVTWAKPKLMMATVPQIAALNTPGAEYYYYATFVSPDTLSDQATSATGYLYYAKGVQNAALGQNTHSWYRRSVTIQ